MGHSQAQVVPQVVPLLLMATISLKQKIPQSFFLELILLTIRYMIHLLSLMFDPMLMMGSAFITLPTIESSLGVQCITVIHLYILYAVNIIKKFMATP